MNFRSQAQRVVLCFAAALSFQAAHANPQTAATQYKKVAITSLIGDTITVDVYRKRVGTMIDVNDQEVLPNKDTVFDEAAMKVAAAALGKALPATSLATLAVPEPGSDLDPAQFLVDGRISPSHRMVSALRDAGFTHLLVISKHRGPARLRLAEGTIGSGYLRGLGFYVDSTFKTKRLDTLETGTGFIAPYVYIRLALVDLATLQQVRERTITEGFVRSAARNEEGFDAWGAMKAEEKVSALQRLIRSNIEEAVPLLLDGVR